MSLNQTIVVSLCVLLGLRCGGTSTPQGTRPSAEPAAETPPLLPLEASAAFPPRFFSNASGVTLTMVYLEGQSGKAREALARFTGIKHPLAGKVVRIIEHPGLDNFSAWKLRYDGDWRTMVAEKMSVESGNFNTRTVLWIPGSQMSTKLEYQGAASRALVPSELFAIHREQVEDGSIATLEALNRPYHQKYLQDSIDDVSKKIDEACQSHLPIEIQWDRISDDELGIGVGCAETLGVLSRICSRDESSRATLLRMITEVSCSAEDEYALAIKGTVLHASVTTDNESRWEFAYAQISKMLSLTRTVLQNEAGQFLIFDPEEYVTPVFYLGDGAVMHRTHMGEARRLWGPRKDSYYRTQGPNWIAECPLGDVEFKPVSDEVRRKLLRTAKFEEPIWKRTEFALARDDRGTYYYVDRVMNDFGGKNFRVFKGPRGQVRQTPLIDIVNDSDSTIFATEKGKLRLVLGKEEVPGQVEKGRALWITGKKRIPLVMLPLQDNRELIYINLGAYDGDELGTICN